MRYLFVTYVLVFLLRGYVLVGEVALKNKHCYLYEQMFMLMILHMHMCYCHVICPTLLKVRIRFIFVPLLEYKRRYDCVVFSVEKLSCYPSSIINGKREFYLKTSLVTV